LPRNGDRTTCTRGLTGRSCPCCVERAASQRSSAVGDFGSIERARGPRQIESAIREVQSVVEAAQPQNRLATIARLERELQELQQLIRAIDRQLEGIAAAHLTKIGPRAETPAELAQRVVKERDAYAWFADRPPRFSAEIPFSDREITALYEARRRCNDLLDHIGAYLPSSTDIPAAEVIVRCHEDLLAAAAHELEAASGPARPLRISPPDAVRAHDLARIMHDGEGSETAVARSERFT
jgi:hypothetical protein